jgi:hypothetical protein
MLVASLAFTLVYVAIALQGPRVWGIVQSPSARLAGVLFVQAIAIGIGFFVFLSVGALLHDGDSRAVPAAARSILLPIVTIIFSFVAAIVHWAKHAGHGHAAASFTVKYGVPYIQATTDPLKAELRLREEAEYQMRRLQEASAALDRLRAEHDRLVAAPCPQGDPKHWPTQVLRAEVERRDQVEVLARRVLEASREVDVLHREAGIARPSGAFLDPQQEVTRAGADARPTGEERPDAQSESRHSAGAPRGRSKPVGRVDEAAELRRRLDAIEQWNKEQRS